MIEQSTEPRSMLNRMRERLVPEAMPEDDRG